MEECNTKFCKYCGEKIDKDSIVCSKCGRQLELVKNVEYNEEAPVKEVDKFYEKTWFMWLMLMVFAPVGIFFMWKFNTTMKKNTKIILSIIFGLLFIVTVSSESNEPAVDNSSLNNNIINNEVVKEDTTKKVEVIDFSQMEEYQIITWCNDNNLDCDFKREYSNSVAKDDYIKQSVSSKEQVKENTKITVTFSLGKEPTVSQKNAVKMANDYLKYSSFSRKGLIEQLEYEGFSNADAVYGVDSVSVDWNEQAVKTAESYLKYSAFSRKGLIEQLEYEGFTHKQAVYGVEQNGL